MDQANESVRFRAERDHRAVADCRLPLIIRPGDVDRDEAVEPVRMGRQLEGDAVLLGLLLVADRPEDGGIEPLRASEVVRAQGDVAQHPIAPIRPMPLPQLFIDRRFDKPTQRPQ